ncbi:uncharacterized protein LOC130810454 [Amaranthus tricolor]|uniref:uncharacterized protein LOC130810454 n=1 Tax=Amaranthus tricolor TaxID=29722 RepID=UPI002589D15D|nr:uncharacterized protein LOC130810454 [Amaranthus tricolor]
MKAFGFCMLLLGFILFSFNSFSRANPSLLVSGSVFDGDDPISRATSSNLKENKYGSKINQGSSDGEVNLEDYRPFDPSPSSKASVRPGPIEHGTPLMPYIPSPRPKPSPPHSSNHDESP